MRRGKVNCCEEVVKLKLKRFGHVKCSHDRKPRHKEGKWLNHVMGEKMFEDENLYRVCDQFVRKNQSSTEHGKSNSFLRIQNNQPKIVGLVKVSMDGEETQTISPRSSECSEEGEIDSLFTDYLKNQKFRKKFMDLSQRRRRDRIQLGSRVILKLCSVIDDAKDINNKKDVANDVVIFIDAIKEYLVQTVLKQDLNNLTECIYHRPASDDEDCTAAVALLSTCSRNDYKRITDSISTQFKLSQGALPSFYEMTKNRPNFEESVADVDATHEVPELDEEGDSKQPKSEKAKSNQPILVNQPVLVGKLGGGYEAGMTIMLEKTSKKRKIDEVIEENEEIIVINSYDGAEHSKNHKSESSLISFSSQMFNEEIIRELGYSTASPNNIFTWAQLRGPEKPQYVLPFMKGVYQEIKTVLDYSEDVVAKRLGGKHFSFYEVSDGKMLYMLLQHSLYNRKNKPFLLCTCQRGEGVRDRNLQCKVIPHEKQVDLYNNSKKRWERQKGKTGDAYTKKKHMDWVDEKNDGCSHFGISPNLLRRDCIRFDMFHLRGAITKRLMTYLRKYILGRSLNKRKKLEEEVLKTFWNSYNIDVWKLKANFNSFIGSEIKAFIDDIPTIVKFMKNEFTKTKERDNIVEGLESWSKIVPFLQITKIDDQSEYEVKMSQFLENLKDFYEVGGNSFLTKGGTSGDDETFYMHCLRFYLPDIAKKTLKDHKLGLGVFTMQGFEHQNKISKRLWNRFNNHTQKVLVQNLNRLFDAYYHDCCN